MTIAAKPAIQRLRITLRGAVQGVGFRPFVYRLGDGTGADWMGVELVGGSDG